MTGKSAKVDLRSTHCNGGSPSVCKQSNRTSASTDALWFLLTGLDFATTPSGGCCCVCDCWRMSSTLDALKGPRGLLSRAMTCARKGNRKVSFVTGSLLNPTKS
eukprot:1125408-Amphidinium_carterae.2